VKTLLTRITAVVFVVASVLIIAGCKREKAGTVPVTESGITFVEKNGHCFAVVAIHGHDYAAVSMVEIRCDGDSSFRELQK
jgi:hypothetical protein